MKKIKRSLAMVLAAVMLLALLPAQTFAGETKEYSKPLMDAIMNQWNTSDTTKSYYNDESKKYEGASGCAAFSRYAFYQLYGHTDHTSNGNNTSKKFTCATPTDLLNYLRTYAAPGDAFRVETPDTKYTYKGNTYCYTHIMNLFDITSSNQIQVYHSNYDDGGTLNTATFKTFANATKIVEGITWSNGAPKVTAKNGKFTATVTLQIIHAKENTKTSADFGNGGGKFTYYFDANGGTGTMSPVTAVYGTKVTIPAGTFTNLGYKQSGWYVRRDADNKFYVVGQGWLTEAQISAGGYSKKTYNQGGSFTVDDSWTKGYSGISTYTFFAIWEPSCTHDYVLTEDYPATCTEDGYAVFTCSICGYSYTTDYLASGHSYSEVHYPATCTEYGRIEYTCGKCGDSFEEIDGVYYSDWEENYPENESVDHIESRTEYRYSDYITVQSDEPTLADWTCTGSEWVKTGTGTVQYVSSWPAGFLTTNANYTKYNNTPVTASETETDKTVVDSDKVVGYLYWHWCRNSYTNGPINRAVEDHQTSTYTGFHCFYSTTAPGTLTTDGIVYQNGNAAICKDTYWYYALPVRQQSYSVYKLKYNQSQWSVWSYWDEEPVEASDTRRVETRTVYRTWSAPLANHSWSVFEVVEPTCTKDGYSVLYCTSCGIEQINNYTEPLGHKFEDGYCVRCGTADPDYAAIQLGGGSLRAVPGDTIRVPVYAARSGWFAGFTLSIALDDGLTLVNVEKGELLKNAEGSLTKNVAQGLVNWAGTENICADGELLILTVQLSETAEVDRSYAIRLGLKDGKPGNMADADESPVPVVIEEILIAAEAVHRGDVNGDGEVDTIDAIRLAKYLVDLVELSDAQLRAADVTGDNDVTATDAIRLAKYLVGLIDTLDKSPARAAQRAAGDEGIAVVEAEIAVGEAAAKPGETVIVPVSISGNPGFAGFTLTVAGAEGLTLTNIEKGELLANADGMFTKNVAQSRVNWTSSENITGDGTLLMLSFALDSDAADGTYAVSVELKDGKQSNFANAEEAIVAVTFSAGKITVGEAHEHQYTAVVTPPTCTEQGYTTYTCACGDSYVADEVAATGHNYVDGVCTVCDEADPAYQPTNLVSGTCGKQGDNLIWTYNPATKVLTITGSGEMADDYAWNAPWAEFYGDLERVVIESGATSVGNAAFYGGYSLTSVSFPESLTSVGTFAFWGTGLERVTIPAGLTEIGARAFQNCYSLTEIRVAADNPNYTDVDGVLFSKDKTVLIQHPSGVGGTYAIPDGVKTVGQWSFAETEALTDITIPDSVTKIEAGAFYDCPALLQVTVPASVTEIGGSALGRWDPDNEREFTVEGFTIYGYTGTAAQAYAKQYAIKFVPLDGTSMENPFVDVKDNDWFKTAVLWAVSQKPAITNGTDATHFSPTKTCTRAEVVQFLWNAAGQPAVDAASNPFSDVKANDWYYKAVMWAVSNGITSGTDATHFAPGKKCTRAEVVAFLRNASTDKEVKTTTNPFTDVKASDWYYNSVLWAVERGITSGTTPTTFAPTKTCTRAEVVQFLYKAS